MKRFYRDVRIEPSQNGFRVLLDGRPVRTPGRHELRLPSAALAEAVAEEWRAQGEEIRPPTMHVTRLATTVVDLMPARRAEVVAETRGFARHELLCYRAGHPRELVARQRRKWDPWLDWAERELAVRLVVTEGVLPVDQEEGVPERFGTLLDELDDFALVGLHAVARLTHSIVLAFAVARGALDGADAFEIAYLEELWEIEQWGREREQTRRHAALRAELDAAARYLAALRG